MGFFKRKKTIAERFPADRLAMLPMSVGIGAPTAAKSTGLDEQRFLTSRFFAGYLLAYPGFADDIAPHFGASIRKMLFSGIFGEQEGEELHQLAMEQLRLNDSQVRFGFGFGLADGEVYFKALEVGQRTDHALDALKSALEINACDIEQQISN